MIIVSYKDESSPDTSGSLPLTQSTEDGSNITVNDPKDDSP